MDNERACWKTEYLEGLGWCIIDQERVRSAMTSPFPGDNTEPGLVAYGYATREKAQASIDDPTALFWGCLGGYLESGHPRQQCLIYELFEGQPGHLAWRSGAVPSETRSARRCWTAPGRSAPTRKASSSLG